VLLLSQVILINRELIRKLRQEEILCVETMLIRVRTNVGLWRVDGLDDATAKILDVRKHISNTRPDVKYESPFSSEPQCQRNYIDESIPLSKQGFGHGSMIYCRVDPSTCAEASTGSQSLNSLRKVIGKDGNIQMVQTTVDEAKGFRKGMMPLRDMKMSWTLNDFIELDSQYEFKIKRQEETTCKGVSLDTDSISDFQSYLRRFDFSRPRCAYLYGKFSEDNKVLVEAIYEPPQEVHIDSVEGFVILDDPMEDTVEQIAEFLGLSRVGWIFGHPPRGKNLVLTGAEIIQTAEFQLQAAEGVEETPFVTVKVTLGDDGNVSVEAFQVSLQCMSMVAEDALLISSDPAVCLVHETFTAIQEGKASRTVDNNFFLNVVPIVQHTSDLLVSQFPKFNRDHDDRLPNQDAMKKQLSKSGTAGWTFVELLADFNLLIFISKYLDMATDMPKICESIVDRDKPLNDGYKLIIGSLAGLDNAY
jgi:nuclear protein localization protein 4 homolog